jgi:uncharacterized protein
VSAAGDAPIDLRPLALDTGASVELTIPLTPIALRLGGQDYTVEGAPDAGLTVSRSLSGVHLRLRVSGELSGPCWRCLDQARVPIAIDAREFAASGRDPDAPFDDDLDSSYVEDDHVDVALWVRDAFAEAVPPMILCREDCAGLCPGCGVNRNTTACDCARDERDSRWDRLREIADRMGLDDDAGTGAPS